MRLAEFVEPATVVSERASIRDVESTLAAGAPVYVRLASGWHALLPRSAVAYPSTRLVIDAPTALMRFIAEKGSVALDGVSLTVNEVGAGCFGVNIIPHTRRETSLGQARPGDALNLEIDLLARYVARLSEAR